MSAWTRVDQVYGLASVSPSATPGYPPPAAAGPPSSAAPLRTDVPSRSAPLGIPTGCLIAAAVALLLIVGAGGTAAYYFLLRDGGLPASLTGAEVQPSPTTSPTAPLDAESAAEPTTELPVEEQAEASPTDTPAPTPSVSSGDGDEPAAESAEEPAGEPTGETVEVVPEEPVAQPAEVVEAFVLATLGTLPGAELDEAKARSLMTTAYAPQFDTPGFIPLTYGIQDGPTRYQIAGQAVSESGAMVEVVGYWGESADRRWDFSLQKEEGQWRIAGIQVEEAEGSTGETTGESAFWQLNPAVSEFTVYANGGYKLVVTFDQPAEDIDATFKVEYRREDDGSLIHDQESTGVIEAGRDKLTLDSDWTGYDLGQMGFNPGQHRVLAFIDGVEIAGGELLVE